MGAIATLTTVEAAAVLEVSPVTVRSLVHRGILQPLERGARPLLFDQDLVEDLKVARRSAEQVKELHRRSDTFGGFLT